ncbi:hypothetical protein TNCV_3048571 [Trichonephila clavipes]|nr:hypothetical protein TNCV_3048571 [Trichonephila clavipes]
MTVPLPNIHFQVTFAQHIYLMEVKAHARAFLSSCFAKTLKWTLGMVDRFDVGVTKGHMGRIVFQSGSLRINEKRTVR